MDWWLEGYNDIKTDDTIEAYIMEEIKNKRLTRKKRLFWFPSVLNTKQKGVPMASHFRTDRVGWKSSEVNEIIQKKVRDPRVQGVGDYGCSNARWFVYGQSVLFNYEWRLQTIKKAQTGLEVTGTIKRELGRNWNCTRFRSLLCQRRVYRIR